MSKLEALKKGAGGNALESLGVGVSRAVRADHAEGMPARLRGIARARNAAEIPVGMIAPDPGQPREEFEPGALERLAESLRTRGQLQPIRVRWDEGRGHYVIVCGERRWRAAGMAGLEMLSCVTVDGPLDAAELLAVQLVENCLREDLRPVEQARAFRTLMDAGGLSTRDLARELAVPQSSVVKALALLELPRDVAELVDSGKLAAQTAYEVSRSGSPEAVRAIASRVVAEGLTRAEAVAAVRAGATEPATARTVNYDVAPGVRVSVRFRGASASAGVEVLEALRLAAAAAAADSQ